MSYEGMIYVRYDEGRVCRVCAQAPSYYGEATPSNGMLFNLRTKVWHFAEDHDCADHTRCGHDATRPWWWWPE